jgi:hypothetical protein
MLLKHRIALHVTSDVTIVMSVGRDLVLCLSKMCFDEYSYGTAECKQKKSCERRVIEQYRNVVHRNFLLTMQPLK